MKILEIKSLSIPDVKVIKFARFMDDRGYFSEQFRKSDLMNSGIESLKNIDILQGNQSYSKKGVIRGMHFQWNPYMGKLVRTLSGNMIDLVLDIRKGSPTLGKMIGYEMPASDKRDYDEWIWVPAGFAHGNFFTKDSKIEYICSGEYSLGFEAGISPLAKDIDWSLCDKKIKSKFVDKALLAELASLGTQPRPQFITPKDMNGFSVEEWLKDERSENFVYKKLKKAGL